MKTCLISGSSGLIGSNLVAALSQAKEPCEITTISRRLQTTGSQNITPLMLDLNQNWHIDDLPQTMDTVVHLAQSEHFRDFPDSAESVFSVNTLSTLKLLEYARKVGAKTFILASSGGVYGFGSKPFSEDSKLSYQGELGFYMKTKLCSEILAESYSEYMNVVILRFFFVYGPGQRESMLIPRLVNSVSHNKPIQIQGDDGLHLNPTYVEDAAMAIVRAMHLSQSTTINVGGPTVLSLKEITSVIGKALNRQPIFETGPAAERSQDLIADLRKMNELLGPPKVTFESGIERYIQQTLATSQA